MTSRIFDLHSHTTASDGKLSPRELVRLAKSQGLSALAITDHDTVAAIPEAMDEAAHREGAIDPDQTFASEDAALMLLGTLATESDMALYSRQVRGPALSPYQIEPATYDDLFANWIAFRPAVQRMMEDLFGEAKPEVQRLIYDGVFSTCIARLLYWRVPEALPAGRHQQAAYYKQYYNTNSGKGSVTKYLEDCRTYVDDPLT